MVALPTHPRFMNLLGRRFHRLIVKEYLGKKGGKSYWKCLCDCGEYSEVRTSDLLADGAKSCGCFRYDVHTTHGMAFTPEYWAWHAMIRRCTHINDIAYDYYGGRGIMVCKRWMVFSYFSEDMPMRPSSKYSLDRIDNAGNYSCGKCPECISLGWTLNVRWATKAQQMRNRRGVVWITFAGITLCAKDWGRLLHRHPVQLATQYRQDIAKQF